MNILTLKSERRLFKGNFEKIYERENKITSIRLNLPAKVGNYNTNECNIELRAYIGGNDFIGYEVVTSSTVADVPITTDITEKAQTVNFMCYITHNGNVIGKTNLVSVEVLEAPEEKEPLTPREQFDTVIAEQRQTIANQAETISEQTAEITEKDGQITDLNGQVTELTGENEFLRDTVDTFNKSEPKLETPDIVTPSGETQVIRPSEDYVGLKSVTVDRVTADVDPDIQPENIKEGVDILGVEGVYNPFPERSVGGIYITDVDEDGYPKKFLIKNYERSLSVFLWFFDRSEYAIRALEEFVFEDCPNIIKLDTLYSNGFFQGFLYLKKVVLPENLAILASYTFKGCSSITDIFIPNTVTSIGARVFGNCTSLSRINIPFGITEIGVAAFENCVSLEFVTIENGFNCNNLNLSASTLYSADTIVSWLEALADRTGETAYTLTIGTTNINKLTAEQRAIATNKNWNLA